MRTNEQSPDADVCSFVRRDAAPTKPRREGLFVRSQRRRPDQQPQREGLFVRSQKACRRPTTPTRGFVRRKPAVDQQPQRPNTIHASDTPGPSPYAPHSRAYDRKGISHCWAMGWLRLYQPAVHRRTPTSKTPQQEVRETGVKDHARSPGKCHVSVWSESTLRGCGKQGVSEDDTV
jgi:hypothetical protein